MKTFISLFSGGGGSSLGYQRAGFKELLAAEWDLNAIECLEANFPKLPLWTSDISDLSVAQILARTGLRPGELDLLEGSPPCQGFSTANPFGSPLDSRNSLFREFRRILVGLQPKSFVMENVSSMSQGAHKQTFLDCLALLRESGYVVKCAEINAKFYNVPQARKRLFFVGIRNDIRVEPSFPPPLDYVIPLKKAFKGVTDNNGREFPQWLREAANLMEPGNYSRENAVNAFIKVKGNWTSAPSFMLLSWDRYACTLTKTWRFPGGLGHPDRERYLSLQELKRISSFPDSYFFPGKFEHALARMGNCVPPKMAEALGRHLWTLI
jgi:DNA (cytosine-5)-methyltransferase 1